MFKLRDYQIELSIKANAILSKYNIVYLLFEVRTGKTLTSLNTAELYGATNVLFITKKKAISSIEHDYNLLKPSYKLTVINNESLHKVNPKGFDLLISDEHHRNGAFPKPNKVTKLIKQKYSKLPMIFLSGTAFPESYSQVYHQFWISASTPFKETNFYRWADDFVTKKDKYLGTHTVVDYSNANYDKIKPIIKPLILTFTQKEAGFETHVNENVLYVEMQKSTYTLCNRLIKDRVIDGRNEVVLADTSVKLQSKLHQMYSGTVKFESGNSKVIDFSKAKFIRDRFESNKIAIFYKFKAELEALQDIFNENLTTDLEEFNSTDKNIALQIVSGREGISLKEADYLVYYNIDFSSVSYWQSRDRLTTMSRKSNDIFWIFSKGGIEEKIYKSVMSKKDYNNKVFKKDYE